MWLRKPTVREPSVLFPWTVSDYPLVDAIEAGLVKIPRVPIRDESGADVPAFRNLHTTVKETLGKAELPPKGQPLPHIIEDALTRMIADYEHTCAHYAARGVKPILIVVADTIKNAERLFAELGGWRRKSVWVPGRFAVLSNIDEIGHVKPEPPTLLVHSRMDETEKDTTLAGKIEDSDNAAIHIADEDPTAAQRMDAIRALFNTAGQPGEPGARLQCIVSVGMLTEGWDAKTVTHVVGYRSFESDLLCEQVAGRALRRSVGLEPGASLSTEYANIIGIPFHYMQATEQGDPGESKERWTVYTVPDRSDRRIELPRVKGWRRDHPGPKATLKTPLKPMGPLPDTHGVGAVQLGGEAGEELALSDERREQPAIWRLAEQVRIRCRADDGDNALMDRIESFASVVRATETYLKLRGQRASNLTTDGNLQAVSADIARHLQWGTADDRIVATMDDPRFATTADRYFETTLLRYPQDENAFPARSELNAAACHSEFERHIARQLDQVPGVDAWTRNFRLGWNIPWYDPLHARWHDYEPDFIARVPRANGADGCGHLIVEVKGQRDLRSDEKMRAALTWCERGDERGNRRNRGSLALQVDRRLRDGRHRTHQRGERASRELRHEEKQGWRRVKRRRRGTATRARSEPAHRARKTGKSCATKRSKASRTTPRRPPKPAHRACRGSAATPSSSRLPRHRSTSRNGSTRAISCAGSPNNARTTHSNRCSESSTTCRRMRSTSGTSTMVIGATASSEAQASRSWPRSSSRMISPARCSASTSTRRTGSASSRSTSRARGQKTKPKGQVERMRSSASRSGTPTRTACIRTSTASTALQATPGNS